MPVTITFHKIKEKKPEHDQNIIWLEKIRSYGYYGFNPKSCKAEYYWQGNKMYDSGRILATGTDICYCEGDEVPEPDTDGTFYVLALMTNTGCPLTDDDLWVSEDEYWECFDE